MQIQAEEAASRKRSRKPLIAAAVVLLALLLAPAAALTYCWLAATPIQVADYLLVGPKCRYVNGMPRALLLSHDWMLRGRVFRIGYAVELGDLTLYHIESPHAGAVRAVLPVH